MSGGWIIEFKKPFIKCVVPLCKRKHYAKGYCERHYHKFCRGEYRYTLQEYQDMKLIQKLKEKRKENYYIEMPIKNKATNKLYQKLKEKNIKEFKYVDIINLTGWKYERIKKHILRLVKLGKILSQECHSGGGSKQAKFRMPVTI